MQQSDTKTERVAVTLSCDVLAQCRSIGERAGLTLSKVLEQFARDGVRRGLTLTFTPGDAGGSAPYRGPNISVTGPSLHGHSIDQGLKPTSSQTAPGELSLDEVFEPPPRT